MSSSERGDVDKLAELFRETPPSPETHAGSADGSDGPEQPAQKLAPRPPRRRSRWVALGVVTAVALGAGGYTAACALAPLADPTVSLAGEAEATFSNELDAAQAIVDGQAGPAAIGWQGDEAVITNDPNAYSIASISKLVTLLVGLEQQPLEPGTDGPSYTWTGADAARQAQYLALDGVAFPIPIGTEVTTRQMLTLALLPSANDFAAAYASWVIGDDEVFSAAVTDWAARNGLESVYLAEPTGMDEANVASAADVVRIGRLALANPAIAELTRLPSAELPWGIGTVENTNPLLASLPGVVGLKTGRSSSAGYNLVTAQETDASGRAVVKITAVLGRGSESERAEDSAAILGSMDASAQPTELVSDQQEVGTAVTIDGIKISLLTDGTASTVLLPGESASVTTTLDALGEGPAGQTAGSLQVTSPTGESEVPVITNAAIMAPDLWWRLTHPALVFGWE